MLIKAGVDISRLNPEIRRTLTPLEQLWKDRAGEELVITSTYEGNHTPSSLHYHNDAIDVRWPIEEQRRKQLIYRIRDLLGKDFDVVSEMSHIHIEYDPKRGGE